MILNQAQAEAVYSAMCALNNVSGRILADLQETIHVREMVSGSVYVSHDRIEGIERYADQSAFAVAYGLS